MLDYKTEIAIVGGGPSGLATADTLQRAGWSVMVFERGAIAQHVSQYPTYMEFFSTSELVELGGMPLTIASPKPNRQEYLNYLRRFTTEREIDIKLFHGIETVEGSDGAFRLSGHTRYDDPFTAQAEKIILATGAYATPEKLNVPGEDLPKVSHYFKEVHPFYGSKVLVIGGGNSAAEAALDLYRAGVEVSLLMRRTEWGHIKYWVKPDIENRISAGEIPTFRPAQVLEIRPRSVIVQVEGQAEQEIENDYVLAMTGYRPDPKLLGVFGIEADPATGRPEHNPETFESSQPGIYMVGVMLAGNVSSAIFIENSRFHGQEIANDLKKMQAPRT